MEKQIGVGVLIGLVFVTTYFIWKSDNFTKPQKVFLSVFIVFPPAQWVLLILIFIFNKYQLSQNIQTKHKSSLADQYASLKTLRQKGVMSEEEYNEKIKILNKKNIDIQISNTDEFKSLQKLLQSGLLSEEEYKNKIESLKINLKSENISIDETIQSDAYVIKTRHIIGVFIIAYIIGAAVYVIFS